MKHIAPCVLASLLAINPSAVRAAGPASTANYDESLVGSYELPDPRRSCDGLIVETSTDWIQKRRPEILRLFEEHVYGHSPAEWGPLVFAIEDEKNDALGDSAIRRLVRISLRNYPQWNGMQVLLYLPKKQRGKVPCFVGLNFRANHGVTFEKDVPLNSQWLGDFKLKTAKNPQDPESTRGLEHSRWNPEALVSEGFAVATAYYGDLEPDYDGGWKNGLRAALSPDGAQTEWKPGQWGGIGAWAWGLSRILDYLQSTPEIDGEKCAVIGHSRLGKTALWAGAQDERFSIVISNNSGEGGASLMRRNYGETVAIITSSFPHWFTPTFKSYARNEGAAPVDQHMLIALAAPRPVAIGSAADDRWADPKGEFLSGWHAGPVYALFGKKGIPSSTPPPVGQAVGEHIGYHLRPGPHDINAEDWKFYLRFCKHHWQKE